MSSPFSARLSQLEEQVCDAAYLSCKHADAQARLSDYDLLQKQVIALGDMGCDDETDNCRMMALMLMCAYLRQDLPTVGAFTEEILKELAGRESAMSIGDTYLFLGLFMATRNPLFRTASKKYIQQHADIPPVVRRLFSMMRNLKVRKTASLTEMSYQKQQLIAEMTGKKVIVVRPSEAFSAWTTDGVQDYRRATIEEALEYNQAYRQLKATLRPEYTPRETDTLEQLRCHGGIALARRDPNLVMEAFRLAEERLKETPRKIEQMLILESMYHMAGCDSSLLMEALKQRCDRYFDRHLGDMRIPSGLFPDEMEENALSYRLLFCRHLPKVGAHTGEQSPDNRRWLSLLRHWADALVEPSGGIWQSLSLANSFQLQRYILQTGCINVAAGNKRKAASYRNHVSGAFFDGYLQLINRQQPEAEALVSCYQMLREWRQDIAANQQRYDEFIRLLSRCQQHLKPESSAWLQLEEARTDYTSCKEEGRSYKLLCR